MTCPSCPHPLSRHYSAYLSRRGDASKGIPGKNGFRCDLCNCWLDEWPKETKDQGELFQ
jgi:hypothetical protein